MANPNSYYPPWAFYFKVEFGISQNADDVRFQSVSGLSVEYEYEMFREGGENRFEHKLPGRTSYSNVTFKRGMLTNSEVTRWLFAAFRNREFTPSDVTVILMNEKGEPLRTWKIAHAIPKNWMVSDLNANDNAIMIETLELTYRYFTIE